jgi:hypothetical protein
MSSRCPSFYHHGRFRRNHLSHSGDVAAQKEFAEVADAPVDNIQGLSENYAKALKDALGIDTVR